MPTVTKYLPAIAAGAYLVYCLAGGHSEQLPAAIAAFLSALGLSHSVAQVHALVRK
jgi:hypothetical protein